MGLTPLEGLVMGTRSAISIRRSSSTCDTTGMSVDAINKLLTKESGLLGLTEVTSDCRYVEDNYATKEDAKRAMDVYCHRGEIHRCLHCADGWSSGRCCIHRWYR